MMGKNSEGCYICSGKNWHKTTESFQEEVNTKFPNTYLILGDYVKARQPLLVKRIPCGHEYNVSPDNLLRGKGCPKCTIRQSHYMDLVESIMDKMGVKYEKEKRFEDCKNIRILPFDYYIPNFNTCIEVDGEFHYYKNTSYSNIRPSSSYEEVHKRDLIKDEYCKANNINLIRLPYYQEENFEKIIKDNLYANTEVTI